MNVIHALTCPCQQYDYIGRANDSFSQYLYDHRVKCKRIICEFILGEHIVYRFMRTSFETGKFGYFHRLNSKNNLFSFLLIFRTFEYNVMDLYQYIAHCHVAIKMFLKHYSTYWCLIPMTDEKAGFDDYLYEQRMIYQSNVHLENLSADGLNSFEIINNEFCSDDIVNWYINHVPQPLVHYRFSKRQQYEQYHFF